MIAKKMNGKPYGVVLTAAERKAMNLEINRQIAKRSEQYKADIDATILDVLASEYGWRKKRLRRFWKAFMARHKALREFYELSDIGDIEWLAHRNLKEIGVDIEEWYKEDMRDE